MLCKDSTHLWLGRFAMRLTTLRPDIQWPRAVMRAVAAHAYTCDLDPDYAAFLDATASASVLDSPRSGAGTSQRACRYASS